MLKILLATDGSKNSFRAVDKLIKMFQPLKAQVQITVLSVVKLAPGYSASGLISQEVGSEKATKELLDLTEQKFRENGMQVVTMLRRGQPAEVICNFAEEGNFDIVVMGSRGLGEISEVILGSVSNHVVHCSKKAVMIVK